MADVTLTLDADQALVLFELLARRREQAGAVTIEHEGEARVLDMIEATLEGELAEPFAPDYRTLLEQSRARLAG